MEKPKFDSAMPGLAALGGIVTGILGLILTFVAMQNGEIMAAALFLLAAAVAFGALVNAIFRS